MDSVLILNTPAYLYEFSQLLVTQLVLLCGLRGGLYRRQVPTLGQVPTLL